MKKSLTATVVSNKMKDTVVVEVSRKFRHPLYQKIVSKTKKYKAHTDQLLQVGDEVIITATRPIAKTVNFQVSKKLS